MNKKGFTLLEILVALAVLSMIVFMVSSISSVNMDAEDRAGKRDKIFQMGRLAMQRIVEDVDQAFLVTNSQLLGNTKDGAKIEVAFIGDDKGNFDSMHFNSMSNWRMFRDARESEQAEIGYYAEADKEEREKYRLMRRRSPYLDNKVEEGGDAYPVAEGISAFELEYYDGRQHEWTKNWNSTEVDQKDKLPRAVKITLSFPNPVDEEEKIDFTTIAFIELWQFPIEF